MTPDKSGVMIESNVYLMLFVSFKTVNNVVAQGKWNILKMQAHTAVLTVHPFEIRIVPKLSIDEKSFITFVER